MEQRLQQLLQMESLTPSQFADKMGIQRSGISHILAGRNKPSYDFIAKLLDRFPALNAEWIILGKGKPYKENNTLSDSEQISTIPVSETKPLSLKEPEKTEILLFHEPAIDYENPSQSSDNQENIVKNIPLQPSENRIIQQNEVDTPQKSQPKTVEKVILLYNDGTYELRP